MLKSIISTALLLAATLAARAQDNPFAAANDVTWNTLGTNENSSMPLGNGDVALNVWTELNGDIVLLVAKADAWSENCQLLKLGRVRVRLEPNPFASSTSFAQTLKLESGEIRFQAGKNRASIWVDANHPAVHFEGRFEQPVSMKATIEPWRTSLYHLDQHAVQRAGFFEWSGNPDGLDFDPDVILPSRENSIAVCHFNSHSIYPLVFQREHLKSLLPDYPDPLLHRGSGLALKGKHLTSAGNLTLISTPSKLQLLDLYALTEQTSSPQDWQTDIGRLMASVDAVGLNDARKAHLKWWYAFWNRSWINVTGSPEAAKVSQSYAIQRFMTACASRGPQPIKFNGSLFTVGHDLPAGVSSSENDHDPDYRAWGASFWNQNTRLVYWPLIATGDFDLLSPWFNMYVQALPLVKDRTRLYFHHDGGAFAETMYFWGLPNVNDFGWNNAGPELQSEWMRYHTQGGLEVLSQMLDRYDYTDDDNFARTDVLPMADAVITYYDQHWKRDSYGRILMEPSQSIETYQRDAANPTPDLAGLKNVLPRLLALPATVTSLNERSLWTNVLADLPPIPIGTTAGGKLPPLGHGDPDGKRVILPALKYGPPRNTENPELYTVFPYELYGVGKPDLELARNTFAARLFHFSNCWGQDGMEAALLGLTNEAKNDVFGEFTSYGEQRFPWFWPKNHDWIPDMDNGGAGMMTLQLMLLQCDGRHILLAPAWPEDWTADFKLRAPGNTTIAGHLAHGRVSNLDVIPARRSKDIVSGL